MEYQNGRPPQAPQGQGFQQMQFPSRPAQQTQFQTAFTPQQTVAVPVQPLFGGADVSKWDGTPQNGQGSLIPTRGDTDTDSTTAESKKQADGDKKDYSGKKLALLPRTGRDRSLIITSLIFTLILLLLSVTCLVQIPVQTASGDYMYVPQTLVQSLFAQLDVITDADTTGQIEAAKAGYLELQQKTGFDVYLGALDVNFFTLYYAAHDPMANAGSTAAFYLLLAYTILVPLGLLLTLLRTFFALFGKRTYSTPRALMRMLLPLLFVRIYSLFTLAWGTPIGSGSFIETNMLLPLRAGLDRYNIVVGACALFSFVLVLLARRCEKTRPIKARTTKIFLTLLMAIVIGAGALLLPLMQVTGADGAVSSLSLMDALTYGFDAPLSEGATVTANRLATFAVFAKDAVDSDFVLFIGQYLPFLACALLAFALTAMIAYVLDSNILMEHGIPDKRYAKKVCNGRTSLWTIVLLTLAIGALMFLFNTEIVKYDPDVQFTFNYLFLAPVGGGALLTVFLHKLASIGIKKFRIENRMRKKQFLPS